MRLRQAIFASTATFIIGLTLQPNSVQAQTAPAKPIISIQNTKLAPQSMQRPVTDFSPEKVAAEFNQTYLEYLQWLPTADLKYRPAIMKIEEKTDGNTYIFWGSEVYHYKNNSDNSLNFFDASNHFITAKTMLAAAQYVGVPVNPNAFDTDHEVKRFAHENGGVNDVAWDMAAADILARLQTATKNEPAIYRSNRRQ